LNGDQIQTPTTSDAFVALVDAEAATQTNIPATVSVLPINDGSARVRVTPNPGFAGQFRVRVGARDAFHGTDAAAFDLEEVNVTVAANRIPQAAAQTVTLTDANPKMITLAGDDGDPALNQSLTFILTSLPTQGTLTDASGTPLAKDVNLASTQVRYVPNANFTGPDSFAFKVRDDGGTAGGGQDTSLAATVSIRAPGAAPLPPTSVDLDTSSDTGHFTDDRFTDDNTPTFGVTAEAGKTVEVLVNGTAAGSATETATAGRYTMTLPAGRLRLGENQITFTARDASGTSQPSTALSLVYAPSLRQNYVVPENPGTQQPITFRWTARQAFFNNEVGFYGIDAADGTVNGVAPGSADYARTVLNDATRQVMFRSGETAGASRDVTLTGAQMLGFYLIQNSTAEDFLARNPGNRATGGPLAFFSFTTANPDGERHLDVVADVLTGRAEYRWEDQTGGGDRDFNDVVFFAGPSAAVAQLPSEALRVPGGLDRTVTATARLLPATKSVTPTRPNPAPTSAAISGELGLFRVDDTEGRIGTLRPGDAGYAAAAMSSTTRQVVFSATQSPGATQPLNLNGSQLVGFYFIPNGTAASFLASNSTNSAAGSPVAFFSFDAANPDGIEHFRSFGPERNGDASTDSDSTDAIRIHVLDELMAAATEFDDLLFSLDIDE
jgi:hypothetical protein